VAVAVAAPAAVAPVALAPAVVVAAPQPAPAPGNPAHASGCTGGTGRPSPPLAATGGRELGADFPLDGPRILVGFLVSYENVDIGQYWPIHQGRNVLGRQGAATGLDIEISHPTTSSLHALLLGTASPGRVLVEDTSSTNGTFVNDNILVPGQRWELRDGDRVRFGLFDTVIKIVHKP
jgi:FHA domain